MSLKISTILTVCVLLLSNSINAQLIHPGGWVTGDELSIIREKVAAQEEPWYGAWQALEDYEIGVDYKASVSPIMTSSPDYQKQAHAAYVLTMKWVASGEKAYATAAKNIIDDWVNTVKDFTEEDEQTSLRCGIGSNKMAQAAEILAWGLNGEADWSPASITKAQAWFKDVVYPYISTGPMRSTNFGTSALAGCMSIAIFRDDTAMFNAACEAYKYGFTNTWDGCCNVTNYIINAEGQCYETGRDQIHAQGGISHLVETAMIAWNQGVDLVSFADYRVVAGMEYTAKYNLGYDVPWTSDVPNPCNLDVYWADSISADGRGQWSPIYVLAATLFERAGQAHPYTSEVVTSSTYTYPETHNSDHPGLGTLMYSVPTE